ncbi:LCP family protein [Radiobacillus deserti]|uniref:LytR family transcriptional regulator n=1 Tax=Radiobacillus deserti TaxID=2594883 RepID=A0A516KJB0_9BACI|nr:LCP family protein [Radiobacillus deserti]QDP41475.1 LytR family transcriptional regulator [Radiobacillus deserti]
MSKQRRETRIGRRKWRFRKRFFLLLMPLLVLICGTTVYGALLINKADKVVTKAYEDDGREKSELREKEVDPTEDNVSVLFIGVDDSEARNYEGNSRSDALILATLNKEDKSVKLLSIPRDTYTYIPEVGYNTKINHAHAYGGAPASIEAVEQLLEIPVDYYVRLNFEAFVDVVDTLGGVKVDVPYEMYEKNSADVNGAIHLLPGTQLLDGEEALAFARTRKQDNDIERGKRQQEIIKAIIKKGAVSITKYDNLLEAVGENMTTNMTFDQIKSFVTYGATGNLNVSTLNLAGSDSMIDGVYYYQLDETDLAAKQQELKQHLGLTSNKETTSSSLTEESTTTGTTTTE